MNRKNTTRLSIAVGIATFIAIELLAYRPVGKLLPRSYGEDFGSTIVFLGSLFSALTAGFATKRFFISPSDDQKRDENMALKLLFLLFALSILLTIIWVAGLEIGIHADIMQIILVILGLAAIPGCFYTSFIRRWIFK